METDWAGRHRKAEKRKEGEGRKEGRSGEADFLPKKIPPSAGLQKTPDQATPHLLPLTTPSPSACLARLPLVFPAVGLFLKTPTRSPRPALTLWPQGPQPTQGPHPAMGREGGGEKASSPRPTADPALGNREPQGPGLGRGAGHQTAQKVLEAKSWALG